MRRDWEGLGAALASGAVSQFEEEIQCLNERNAISSEIVAPDRSLICFVGGLSGFGGLLPGNYIIPGATEL